MNGPTKKWGTAVVLVVLIGIPVSVRSQSYTYTWTGKGDGISWTDPDNWSRNDGVKGTVPTGGEDVIIGAGYTVRATRYASYSVFALNRLQCLGKLIIDDYLGITVKDSSFIKELLFINGDIGNQNDFQPPLFTVENVETDSGNFVQGGDKFIVTGNAIIHHQSGNFFFAGGINKGVMYIEHGLNGYVSLERSRNEGTMIWRHTGRLDIAREFEWFTNKGDIIWQKGSSTDGGRITNEGKITIEPDQDIGPAFGIDIFNKQGGVIIKRGPGRFIMRELINEGEVSVESGRLTLRREGNIGISKFKGGTLTVAKNSEIVFLADVPLNYAEVIIQANNLPTYWSGVGSIFTDHPTPTSVTIEQGATLVIGNDLMSIYGFNIYVDGKLDLPSKTFGDPFKITVNKGTVSIQGTNVGWADIQGEYSMDNYTDGVLEMEIGGTNPGVTFDLLTARQVNLNRGNLKVNFINNFKPKLGDRFEIIRAAQSLQGRFASVEYRNLSLDPGLHLEIVYTDKSVILEVKGPKPFVVNSTADRSDQNPGDGACDTGQTVTRPDGSQEDECTLRAAIEEANAKQGADNIAFDIPVNDPGYDPALGIWTIRPGTALPAIIEQVTIDGYTQPGAQPNTEASADSTKKETNATLKVVLNGQQAPKRTLAQGTTGLVLKNHQGSIIRGLVINGFSGDGIRIEGGGDHQILGNFIGTNAAGQARVANGENGIRIVGSSGNYIGGPNAADRNLIAGNGIMNRGGGVRIEEGAANNVVMHNLIGTDRTGKVALFNSAYGVALNGDSTIDNLVENNLISGNRDPQFVSASCAGAGVYITAGAGGNGVAKNFIGTDTQGRQALPNSEGICVAGAGAANWIQENLISGNVGRGIWISGQAGVNRESRGTTVSRNNIGAARDTSLNAFPERIPALGNGIDGIQVEAAPAAEIRDNLIATNGRHGIYVRGDREVRIINNTIVANGGWGIYLRSHQEGLIQRNGIGELTPRRINWRAPGGVVVQPDTSVGNRLARLSNGEGAIRLEGGQNNRIGGAAYLTEGNNLFVAKPGKNAVELIEDALTQTGANSNRLENNVINGTDEGERGVLIVNSSDNVIRKNSVWSFVRSGVAIREVDGRSARRNRITETEFDGIDFFGLLGPPKAIDLEDDGKAERDDRDDQDEGPNRLQNRPEAAAYIDWNGDLVLVYRVDSNPNHAAYPLTVEVFTSLFFDPTALFLQALTYPQASAQQDVRVVLGKAADFGVAFGDLLALTATDNKGNTSEFIDIWVDSIDTETGLDFGDAPETGNPGDPVPFGYPTKLAQDGARHGAIFNIRLGQALDGEADGQPDPFLEGDDAQPSPDDEDGLLFHTPVRFPGVVDPFREPLPQLYPGVQEVTVLNTVSGYVNMWIDFNRDGDWDEPNEYVLQDVLVPTGPRRPRQRITVPATIQPGLTALRVRFTTVDDAATTVTGAAPDGEVEDHLVELLPLPEQPYIDFGDAPDSAAASGYPTLLANQRYPAAGHIVGGPLLGSLVDAEWDGQPDSTASGDGSDEDGVRLAGPLIRGQMAEMEVEVSGAEGYLSAWLDINQDGDWADSTEQIVRDQRLGPGRYRLSFKVPDTAAVGRTYLRVRISSKDSLSFWGIAPDGEVEDYAVEVAPTTAIEGTQLLRQFALEAVYPNPARDRVTLRYALPQATRVRLVVYNVLGQVVRVVVDGRRGPGVYRAVLPVKDLPPGLYVVRLETEALSETRSLMILH